MAALNIDGTEFKVVKLSPRYVFLGELSVAFSGKVRSSTTAVRPYRRVWDVETADYAIADAETREAILITPGPRDITGDRFSGTVPMLVGGFVGRDETWDMAEEVPLTFELWEQDPVPAP